MKKVTLTLALVALMVLLVSAAQALEPGVSQGFIGDRVWHDEDGDGEQDKDALGNYTEPGIANAQVKLSYLNGSTWVPMAEMPTDANGIYGWIVRLGFRWKVEVTLPADKANWSQTYDFDGLATPNVAEAVVPKTLEDPDVTNMNHEYRVDFGYVEPDIPQGPVNISGTVWVDCDGNGIHDAGEPPLEGATVTLYDVDDERVREPIVTGTDGTYAFNSLIAGQYTVVETNPEGFTSTGASAGVGGSVVDFDTINVAATTGGSSYPNQDFLDTGGDAAIDLIKTGPTTARRGESIIYHFVVTNTGNARLNNVQVNDPMLGGNLLNPTVTLKAGESVEFDIAYAIPLTGDLKAGTAGPASNIKLLCVPPPPPPPVEEKLINTATATADTLCGPVSDTDTWTLTITSDPCQPGISLDKSGPATARRGDTITYHFKVTNTGNAVLTGVNVNDPMFGGAILPTGATLQAGQSLEFDITYTIPASGALTAGTHGSASNLTTLCYTPPPPCEEKLINTATATGQSSCGSVSATDTWTVTVSSTSTPATGIIGNRVWYDCDRDGRQDYNEYGISGITVKLIGDVDGDGDTDTRQAITDCEGKYLFRGLVAGQYRVVIFSPPTGKVPTWDYDGISSANYATVNLAAGQELYSVDFGYARACIPTGKIGNRVWYDRDRDGYQDCYESGISGVTVTLRGDVDGDGDYDVRTTTTNCEGSYLFTGLAGGRYTVTVTKPYGYTPTKDYDGTSTPNTATLYLSSGEENYRVDFGYAKTYSSCWCW